MPYAKQDLYISWTKAYSKGSKVSDELVEKYGWKDQVQGSPLKDSDYEEDNLSSTEDGRARESKSAKKATAPKAAEGK